MAHKIAVINYSKCDPTECRDGVCEAIIACKKKVLKQEEPYDAPFINASLCSGCYECIPHCHRNAIEKAK